MCPRQNKKKELKKDRKKLEKKLEKKVQIEKGNKSQNRKWK